MEYINTSQAAEILGMSQGWVAAHCRAGNLKAERGAGQGSPWKIEKSSVDNLAAQLRKMDKDDIEAVAEEIANDSAARELAEAKAEESFLARISAIAKKYGFAASMVVAGVVGEVLFPGNRLSTQLISEGLKGVIHVWNTPSPPKEIPSSPPQSPPPPEPLPPPQRGEPRAEPIDTRTTDEIMAAFRQATRGRGWMEREELLKTVSVMLGYKHLGPKIKEVLRGHLRAAIRRRIIETDGNQVRAGTTTMADYPLDDLREAFASVMRKGTEYEREDVTRNITTYLGFAHLTETSRDAIKSAFNSGIRQGILDHKDSMIWRKL